MKPTQTFSILIWANNKNSSGNQLTLSARITINGKRAEISLKKKVEVNKWDSKGGCVKGNSAETLKLKYTGGVVDKRTILQVFDYHNSQLEKVIGIDVVKATLVKFRTVRTKLAKFIKYHYKKSDCDLKKLNHQFVSIFEFYLKSQENIQHNTSMKYT